MSISVTLTYISPGGRKMSKDIIAEDYDYVLDYTKKVASKPGVTNVKLWNQRGKLIAIPKNTKTNVGDKK